MGSEMCIRDRCLETEVTPSRNPTSVAVKPDGIPLRTFNSAVVDVIPLNVFSSAVVTFDPSLWKNVNVVSAIVVSTSKLSPVVASVTTALIGPQLLAVKPASA